LNPNFFTDKNVRISGLKAQKEKKNEEERGQRWE
jgi:hypothetical protein